MSARGPVPGVYSPEQVCERAPAAESLPAPARRSIHSHPTDRPMMQVAELARSLAEYYKHLVHDGGFSPTQALQLLIAYQKKLLENDLVERLSELDRGREPWQD